MVSAPSATSVVSSGRQGEFPVDSLAGEAFRDHLLALDVAIDAQVAPAWRCSVWQVSAVEINGGYFEVLELGRGRGRARRRASMERFVAFVAQIELQVVAVGADDGLGEADGLVAAGPVEGGLQHDLFCGIALRFVEAGGGLGLAEDIGDAVVADAVAGAEVGVGVVVEGAPADAAGVLRIGGQLVVDAGVADGVLALALVVVDGLGGIGVADELGVEVARMVRLPQRKAEVVHGEDVFEELGLLEVADAAGLARGVELVGQGVGAGVEVVVVARLVDAHAPENDGGMVPVAADHAADIVDRDLLPGLVADVLPAGNLFEDQQADLVAAVEEVPRLRIVRGAHDVAVQVLAQDVGVAALHARGHGLADEGEGLVAVEAAQLDDFAVEGEAVVGEGGLAEADAAGVFVDGFGGTAAGGRGRCRDWVFEVPELDAVDDLSEMVWRAGSWMVWVLAWTGAWWSGFAAASRIGAGREGDGLSRFRNNSVAVAQFDLEREIGRGFAGEEAVDIERWACR